MSDLIDEDIPGRNVPEFSVGEIAGAVKRLIEGELGYVRVRGEVGRVVRARSGHLYFDLKDERNVLSAMTWKGQVAGLEVIPEEGMEVVAEGKMTASGFQSKFSLNAIRVRVAGEGALMAMLEKRKKALAAEGLFDEARKRPLPYLPEIIGVVTSPQGAVIRDILHRLRDRFPRKVLIWPVAVQGAACAPEVARAIAGFNALTPGGALPRPDLLIVARGGGSIEDLWGFNEEAVARAAAASEIPLISAVGHETDTTLIDFVSDQRAPTPTAAAEMAVPVRRDLLAWVSEQGARLTGALSGGLSRREERLRDLARALPRAEALLEIPRQRLDRAAERLPNALKAGVAQRRISLERSAGRVQVSTLRQRVGQETRALEVLAGRLSPALERAVATKRQALAGLRLTPTALSREVQTGRKEFDGLVRRLSEAGTRQIATLRADLEAKDRLRETLSYRATLERGYAVVRDGSGGVLTSKAAASEAQGLEIEFADGRVKLGGSTKAAPKAKSKPPEQGEPLLRKPRSMWSLETLGRVRLSKYFFMREFLYSEIGSIHRIPNIPNDPDLAVERGRAFCTEILDPLEETFGRVAVRSGYRSAELNAFGNAEGLNCARNDYPLECHIWDLPDVPVAGASIAIPWFVDQYEAGRDWRDMAWWLYDHTPFAEAWFFPKLSAFNISWRPGSPQKRIDSYIKPKGTLIKAGRAPEADRARRYSDFPVFRGLQATSAP